MTENHDILDLDKLAHGQFENWPYAQHFCITCGLCASACPASGLDGVNPRMLIRLIGIGLEEDIVASRWPWICTMCGKCENVCPMEIDIPSVVRKIRSMRPRSEVPGILHKGLEAALETGNNLRLPKEDYEFIIQDVAEELAEEPGYETFEAPIDKKGARILTTIHNKLVNTHTDDLKHWWKIFHIAQEDWTVPSENWEGTSWGYFTGDDEAMKTMAARILEHMERLEIDTLLWPE